MKTLLPILLLVTAAGFCFSQPISFKGETTWHDGNFYRIQIGAYANQRNAERTFAMLRNGGLDPQYGEYRQLKRVMITRVRARDIPTIIARLQALGIREVWITRE